MQKIGRLLSAMVYQNIGVFITLGIFRVLFAERGWWPNDMIFALYDPMLHYLVPVLIGYSGGKMLGGQRGGIAASIVIFGMSLGSPVPMVVGSMLVSPLVGWFTGKVDAYIQPRIPIGFELLAPNVVISVIVTGLTILGFQYPGQALTFFVQGIHTFMDEMIRSDWLPLTAVAIEPLKVFFLNNLVNFGILAPLGVQQAKEWGKSIFFLLESNPGPGLGILLAYCLKSVRSQRRTARLSAFIHTLGGVHEVYFPYVMMKPLLLIAVVLGGASGIAVFQWMDAGLVSIASPGSVLFLMFLAPEKDAFAILIGVAVSAFVSFVSGYVLMGKTAPLAARPLQTNEWTPIAELEHLNRNVQSARRHLEAGVQVQQVSSARSDSAVDSIARTQPDAGRLARHVRNEQAEHPRWAMSDSMFAEAADTGGQRMIRRIVFACDAGIASSAMGAALLRKKMQAAGLDGIEVSHSSVDDVPAGTDLVITNEVLTPRSRRLHPEKEHLSVKLFTDLSVYDDLIARLKQQSAAGESPGRTVLDEDNVLLHCQADHKNEAIRLVGKHMVALGLSDPAYIDEMIEREQQLSTYIGNGVAVPHGLGRGSCHVRKPGIVIAQFPEGVQFENNTVYVLIGVAGYSNRQTSLLSLIAKIVEAEDNIRLIRNASTKQEVLVAFRLLNELPSRD